MDKYEELRTQGTNGANYDLDTEDIIRKLQAWDEQYGIEISDVDSDTVIVKFNQLPEDVQALAEEIYEFCPDTIDQHFGCFADLIEAAEEQDVPEGVLELVEGIDLTNENYGLELLQKSLKANQVVVLWWD